MHSNSFPQGQAQGHQQQPSLQLLQQLQRQSQPQQQSMPPRFANHRMSIREMPVYEEEAVDDRNELPSPPANHPQLAPNFQFGASRRQPSVGNQAHAGLDEALAAMSIGSGFDMGGLRQGQSASFGQANNAGGGGAASGINANVLANIAARANQRHQAEYNPVLEQQLMLQQQIELLQEQQRALLQQNTLLQQTLGQPNLSALSQAILAQSAQQNNYQNEDQARLLQEQYIKVLTAQSLAQSQQLAMQQSQSQPPVQTNHPAGTHTRDQSRASKSGMNDFVLPNMSQNTARPASAVNDAAPRTRQLSDIGSTAGALAGHRRRNSVQTHRPQNSIIGSFGGFVADVPDDAVMAHHRANSRSVNGDWRNGGPNKEAVLDLASAQAQLQMLSNFRSNQIGGGGHSKMASFSFPNMLPNLMMASTMGPATQSIVQQQQAFQMQLQQHQGPGPQRKSLFAPYLPQGSLPALLAAGKLVVGVLRVNKRNRSDAYVATDVLDADIYICGSKDRNRALEGDMVAVELLDVDEVWGSKKEKEEKKRKKEENSAYDQGINKANVRKNDKKKDDVEVEGQGMVLFDDEEVTDEQRPTYAGHVVAVVERMTGQLFSGQLGVLRPSSAATKEKQDAERRERGGDDAEPDNNRRNNDRPKIVWFKPTDKRVPLIAIPTEQAPSDFIDRPDAYADKLFVATIKRWPITSLHPFGALVDELGSIGDLETETSALLKDCNFPTEEFQEATMRCLPPVPWTIPEREYEVRRDMRDQRVFSIDPATAKDLDDALSIKKNDDGTYEVGVHIADVSHFVRPNTALDRDARKRATSVYLVQRAVPMLPPLLSEELCSLVPGVERLTFSVFFTLDTDGNVINKQFNKTIIKSCAKLAYDDAQRVLDGGALEKEVQAGHKTGDIEEDIKVLNAIALKLRDRRFKDGALKIDQPKLAFVLDEEGKPRDVRPYERKASNDLIEEVSSSCNSSVCHIWLNSIQSFV
jgi:protein SSD1